MWVKLSFCFVSSNHQQQLGRRLPSDNWQEGSKLSSTSLNTPPHVRRNGRTHASWQYKDIILSMKSSQYDRRQHAQVRDQRPTYSLSAGCIRVNYVLNGPATGVLRLHRRANTRILLGHNFWACSKLVCWQIGLACTLTGKSGRDPCEILTGACFSVGKCQKTVHIIWCKWSLWYEMQLTKLGTFQ